MTLRGVAMVIACSHEPHAWLKRAIESVLEQSVPTKPVIVCDGPLEPDVRSDLVREFEGEADWIHSAAPHRDAGNWARAAGGLHAATAGYEAVGFLDGDNWLEPSHVEHLLALNTDVATCNRFICHIDGTVLHADTECDGVRHVDTSCFLLRRRVFGLLAHWALMPREISPICDQLFWSCARAAAHAGYLTHAHSSVPTVNFRSRYAVHYERLAIDPPPGSKPQIQLPTGTYGIAWPFEQEIVVE